MFFTNNVGAAAYACLAGLGSLVSVAAPQLDLAGAGHLEHVADADALCLTECVKSYRDPTQELAANGLDIVPIPAFSGPCLSVRYEPTRTRIAWAPKAAGPKLFILFGNLRN